MPDSSSRSRLETLFHDALERPSVERRSFLEQACGDDAQLRDRVVALLLAFEHESAFLETPALESNKAKSQILCAPGEELGHYRILRLLGRGGMGEVYLATDSRLGRQVALKLLSLRLSVGKIPLTRFWLEARTASALNHPNILTVYEVGEDRGFHYIAAEYVEGVTLRQMQAKGPLPLDKILNVALQTAAGLMAAHAAGIVHRDIKPENIMVRPDGYVKILDFGLAKLTESALSITAGTASGGDAVTRPGILLGTIGYMSPEQARGLDLDTRSDLFSLGAVIYEMATGKCPFEGETPSDELSSILSETPPPISEVDPSFPADATFLVARLLEKEREKRYQSAGDLIADLQKLRRSVLPQMTGPISSHPLSAVEGISRKATTRRSVAVQQAQKSRLRQLLLLLGLLTVVTVVSVVSWRAFHRAPLSLAGGQRPMILVGDFENRTGQPVFDNSLHELFTSSLEQSPLMEVFPRIRLAEVLRRMNQPMGKHIDENTGLEICQRENLLGLLLGSIVRIGNKYVLLARIESPSGSDIATVQKSADSEDQIPGRIDEITDELRRKLGESAQSLKQNSVPLARVTSSSLEAIRYYTLGKESLYSGDADQAVLMFSKAVELDPDFAAAHEYLGIAYTHLNRYDHVTLEIRKAYSLAGRVSEPERLWIMGFYHDLRLDYKNECETYKVLMQLEPQDPVPYINLGVCEANELNFADAVANTEKALQFVPQSAVRVNLASDLLEQGNTARAMQIAESFSRDFAQDSRAQTVLGRAYLASGRMEDAGKVFENMFHGNGAFRIEGGLYLADLAMSEGRYRDAQLALKTVIFAANQNKNPAAALRARNILAEILLKKKAPARSIQEVLNDVDATPDQPAPDYLLGRDYAWAGQFGMANKYSRRIDLLIQGDDVPALQALRYMLSAEIALAQHKSSQAAKAAEQAIPYHNSVFAVETLARCYAAAGMNVQAAQQYEAVLARSNELLDDFRIEVFDAPALRLAVEAHYRLAVLYQKLGRWDQARTHLQEFLSRWSHADESLAIYKDAERLLRSLPATGTPTPAT